MKRYIFFTSQLFHILVVAVFLICFSFCSKDDSQKDTDGSAGKTSDGVTRTVSESENSTSNSGAVVEFERGDSSGSAMSETAPWESEEYAERSSRNEDQSESGSASTDSDRRVPGPALPRKERRPPTSAQEDEKDGEDESVVSMQMKDDDDASGEEDGAEVDPQQRELERLMSLREEVFFVPEDFRIGPLQAYDASGEIGRILQLARDFFGQLAKGVIEERLIHPDWLDVLKQNLGFHVERGRVPIRVRIGRVEIADEAKANIRMYSEKGRAEGEIFFDTLDGSWYISDIQADFADLDREYQEEEQMFEPESYRLLEIY